MPAAPTTLSGPRPPPWAMAEDSQEARWEAFLRLNPRGQFQQSLRWAYVKEAEGWIARLETWGGRQQIEGGFLMLVKETRFGRVGFVNKGPVLVEENAEAIQWALGRVKEMAAQERLRALILQPPDGTQIEARQLHAAGFCRHPVPGIIDATLVASLAGGRDAIAARMRRSSRQECRRATERGAEVFEGGRDDLGKFFALMCHTCRRQGVEPNPGSVELLHRRWDAFAPDLRVLFACVQGEVVAGLLILRFGKGCTFEKKGWDERFPEAHPNTFLNFEAMVRASEWGCEWVDFGAMDRILAARMLKGEDVEAELARTRYVFNVRLGARPVLLTSAHGYVVCGWQRPLLKWALGRSWLARRLERVAGR